MANNDWSAGAAWMRGKLMAVGEATLPVTDWGLTHSDITYDVVSDWDGRFFRLNDYLSRFQHSLVKCGLSIEQSPQDITDIQHQIVARSRLTRA